MGSLLSLIDSLTLKDNHLLSELKILGVTIEEIKVFLADDWGDYKDSPAALLAWADLIAKGRLIEQGIAPANYTAVTHCDGCGDVFVPPELVNGGKVLGCMWCSNRVKELPIPKPN
jgi:hypothetical protein